MATTENVPGSLDYILRVWRDKPEEPDFSDVFVWVDQGEKYRSIRVHGACAIPTMGEQVALGLTLYEVFRVVHPLPVDSEDLTYHGDELIEAEARIPIVLAYLQK